MTALIAPIALTAIVLIGLTVSLAVTLTRTGDLLDGLPGAEMN